MNKLEAANKNLFYCLSSLLGVFIKINGHLCGLLESQVVKSNFSLSEALSIRNETLELRTNQKINAMEKKEQEIINGTSFMGVTANIQEIMGLVKSPNEFVSRVHEIGLEIFNGSKQLATLSEYRNIYKKEVFIGELKTNLLENKNEQFEAAINHLLKNQPSHSQHKLSKELKDIGVLLQKNGGQTLKKNSHSKQPL